jgi:hypothetical protein
MGPLEWDHIKKATRFMETHNAQPAEPPNKNMNPPNHQPLLGHPTNTTSTFEGGLEVPSMPTNQLTSLSGKRMILASYD